ncbi:YraN family protein [Bifidobacterium leontopitheci]|uniref:UPF0102 protein F7D09_1368 n=1 Tax=Bifidobacterium leontopitheci TaxID=2650774 RepID=A0A6I1GKE1_9BIFI|nr:YraN family protein [Bifidobacterium leontopitheci]KAB7790106.1 endonuclease [Bifidobacterium leontopitheci]
MDIRTTSRAATAGDLPTRPSIQTTPTTADFIVAEREPDCDGPPPAATSRDLLRRLRDETIGPKQLGVLGEQYAALWLERHGHTILDRNWRSRYGELDIITMTPERLIVFAEVKTRRCEHFGSPQEAVTARKQASVRRAGIQWLLDPEHRMSHNGVRFDVLSVVSKDGTVSVHHIPGAF